VQKNIEIIYYTTSLLQNSDQICRSDDEFDDKKGRNILK